MPGRIVATASADVPLKGFVPLFEAVAKLRTERDVALVVVGRPKPGGAAAAAIDRLGIADCVRFVSGFAEDALVDLFGSAQVAVVPSLYEGFSLPAIETLACATPLVATTAGALPEVVGPDGVSALHVPPGDPEALAAAIGRVLDDPELAARLGAAGRARVVELYTWRAVAEQTVAWYRSVLASPPPSRPPVRPVYQGDLSADRRFRPLPGRPRRQGPRHGLRRRPARLRALPPRRARHRAGHGCRRAQGRRGHVHGHGRGGRGARGCERRGRTSHHTHALHSPYWWLKCAVGVTDDANPVVKAYHRLLVWDMLTAPALTRTAERALDPLIGKSLVTYLRKPEPARALA